MTSPARAADVEPAARPSGSRRPEWLALSLATVAVVAAFSAEEWGTWWGDVHAWLEPLSAYVEPTVGVTSGPGLPMALLVGYGVAGHGPTLAGRLPWRRLLLATWLAGLAWSVSLAVIRGWSGIAEPLTNEHEYLVDVPRADDLTQLLPGFTDRIDSSAETNWVTHVAAHPPLTFLGFVWLDRIGLGGPEWGGVVLTLLGSSTVVALLVTLRILGDEDRARLAAPFLALTPLVIWSVVSADGVFAAAAAWGLAVLAAAATAEGWARAGILGAAAGLLLGVAVNLSYGLLLTGALALAVLAAARSWRPLVPAMLGGLAVVGLFAALGFWWLEGQDRLVERYEQGIGSERPQSYWVWANLAIVCFCLGPAGVAALGRWVAEARGRLRDHARWPASWWLVLGALVAIAVADLSGLSKSEVERIWLPFTFWLVPLAAGLARRDHRGWLVAQAGWAVGISLLLRFTW